MSSCLLFPDDVLDRRSAPWVTRSKGTVAAQSRTESFFFLRSPVLTGDRDLQRTSSCPPAHALGPTKNRADDKRKVTLPSPTSHEAFPQHWKNSNGCGNRACLYYYAESHRTSGGW